MDTSTLECFSYVKQEFLVCVTVHKVKNLSTFNADTYVKITLDKKSKTTSVFRNSENPLFNEYFVFEVLCTLPELLRLTVLFEVKKKAAIKRDTTLGELFIDLTTVWNQQGHSFYKKWGKLENPIGSKAPLISRGHLQIDLSIVTRNEPPNPAVIDEQDFDDIEKHLLQPISEKEGVKSMQYKVILYRGTFLRKLDYLVQVSFAGMSGKTKIQKSTSQPEWNEQIAFMWYYPSLSQTFLIQVMVNDMMQWKCVADYEIHFDEIVWPGGLPTIGPTYLQLYDSVDTKTYVGRILVGIRSESTRGKESNPQRIVESHPAPPIVEKMLWATENFFVECVIWQGDFIHSNSNNIKFSLQCGEFSSQQIECSPHVNQLTHWRYFQQDKPHKAIYLNALLPDYRCKFEPDRFLSDFIQIMRSQLENFKLFELKHPGKDKLHSKCLKALVTLFREKLKQGRNRLQYNGFKQLTEWDRSRISYFNQLYENLQKDFESYRKNIKTGHTHYLANISKISKDLMAKAKEIETIILTRSQDTWPDLVLNLWVGGKVTGVCKLTAKNYMYAQRFECRGLFCGKRHSIVLKPITCAHTCKNCGCACAKVDAWIWIGTESERNAHALHGWVQQEPFYYDIKEETKFNCKLYIHQAKVRPGEDETGLCDAKVRVTFLHFSEETSTVFKSLCPVWDEVISFTNITLPGSPISYFENAPIATLEVLDVDTKTSTDYVGCGFLRLSVKLLAADFCPLRAIYEKAVDEQVNKGNSAVQKHKKSGEESHLFKKIVKTKIAVSHLKELSNMSPPPLKWVPISSDGVTFVEILMSGELVEVDLGGEQQEDVQVVKGLPPEIRPSNKHYRICVAFAGLRNFRKAPTMTTGRYRIKIMFSDLSIQSGPSGSRLHESLNFLDPYAAGVVSLPEQLEYWPPIIITHVDTSKNNQQVTIGAALISKPGKYLDSEFLSYVSLTQTNLTLGGTDIEDIDDYASEEKKPLLKRKELSSRQRWTFLTKLTDVIPKRFQNQQQGAGDVADFDEDKEYNWWTKFYNSIERFDKDEDEKPKHRLKIYPTELEKQPEFSYLLDWAEPIPLIQGISRKRNAPPKEESYATLKCQIKIKATEMLASESSGSQSIKSFKNEFNSKFQELSSLMAETKVVVRVYIVRGLRLRSKDASGEADAYVKLQFGSQKISDSSNYIPNQVDPVFGKRFQLDGSIPREHILHISVYDHGISDDLIGCTCIDLEDRLRSKHHATVGIAKEYSSSGYNVWRDIKSPYKMLKEICRKHDLGSPEIIENTIRVAGITFEDSTQIAKEEDIRERLSLSVLKRIDEIPAIGYKLVPEHVETRSLYRSDRPGVEQGKLQLWVELYEADKVPAPIDITSTPAQAYELRVIIYNTKDVILDEQNIFGKSMSDIYLKVWLDDIDTAQFTDVHYRSLTGEGNFNWRMIFPVKYSKAEEMMVISKRRNLFEQQTEEKLAPVLFVQIWDNDSISADDFLGSLNLDLSHCPLPSASSKNCTLKKVSKHLNLFKVKKIKGWFAAKGKEKGGSIGLTGKVEMEMQILTETEAMANPAGKGRNPPNALPEPNRPKTSFNWFTNPLQSLKYIIVPQLKKCCCYLCIIILVLLLLAALAGKLYEKIMFGWIF